MRETAVEGYLTRCTATRGGVCWKWTSPGTAGVPDRLVFLPGGRVKAVELKAPGQPLRPLQAARAATLRALGIEVYVADSRKAIDDLLDA